MRLSAVTEAGLEEEVSRRRYVTFPDLIPLISPGAHPGSPEYAEVADGAAAYLGRETGKGVLTAAGVIPSALGPVTAYVRADAGFPEDLERRIMRATDSAEGAVDMAGAAALDTLLKGTRGIYLSDLRTLMGMSKRTFDRFRKDCLGHEGPFRCIRDPEHVGQTAVARRSAVVKDALHAARMWHMAMEEDAKG